MPYFYPTSTETYARLSQSQPTNTLRRVYFKLVDSVDYNTGKSVPTTGVKVELSKNGATPVNSVNDITEINSVTALGEYYIELTAAELNTLGQVIGYVKPSGCLAARLQIAVTPFDPYVGGVTAANIADAILDEVDGVESGLTLRQLLRLVGAVLLGKVSGMDTATPIFRTAVSDTKPRVLGTTDGNGTRLVSIDPN